MDVQDVIERMPTFGLYLTRVSAWIATVPFFGARGDSLMPRMALATFVSLAIYLPGRPVPITFRVDDVGAHVADRPAGANQRLTVWVDDQPLAPALSLSGPPCALTLGYQAETETVLEGYFEEARLQPAD